MNAYRRAINAHPGWLRLVALVVPLAVAALFWVLRGERLQSSTLLVMTLLVVGAAATGDRTAGFLAAVSSAVWFDFFFTAPYLSLAIAAKNDLELALLFMVVGFAVTELSLWGRRQQAVSTRQAGYIDGVVSMTHLVLSTPSQETLRKALDRHIASVLTADGCRYVDGPPGGGWGLVGADGRIRLGDREVDTDTTGLPFDAVTAIPVIRGGQVVGHFQVTASSRIAHPNQEQLKVAFLLAQLMDRDLASRAPNPDED